MNFFIDAIFGVISGMTASLGLGGGAVLIMYLTAIAGVEQQKSQGINLIFFIPVALVSTFMYAKNKLIDWKIVVRVVPPGIAGAILGFILFRHINTSILSKVFGLFLLTLGLYLIFKKKTS